MPGPSRLRAPTDGTADVAVADGSTHRYRATVSAHAFIHHDGTVLVSYSEGRPALPVLLVGPDRIAEAALREGLTLLLGQVPVGTATLLRVVENEWQEHGATHHELHLFYALTLAHQVPAPPGHDWLPRTEVEHLTLPGGPPDPRQPRPTWHFVPQQADTDLSAPVPGDHSQEETLA